MSEYKDLDGWRKNVDKFKKEWARVCITFELEWERFRETPDSHSFVNLFVETHRTSPYLFGHINAVLYPFLFGYTIYSIVT